MFGESVNVWAALLLTRADCLHSSSFINSFKKKKQGQTVGTNHSDESKSEKERCLA